MDERTNFNLQLFAEDTGSVTEAAAPAAAGEPGGDVQANAQVNAPVQNAAAAPTVPMNPAETRVPVPVDRRFLQHMASLHAQGEQLKQTFPQFDLREELKNPAFRRMTAPHVGLSVEDAYYAVHRREIQTAAMQLTAQRAAEKLSNAIQAGQQRPVENGTSGQATSVLSFDYRSASREQREALKKRILEAHAEGRKIYPGQ